jgi:hypothetical protein
MVCMVETPLAGFISRIEKIIDLEHFRGFLFCLFRSLSPNMLNGLNFSSKGEDPRAYEGNFICLTLWFLGMGGCELADWVVSLAVCIVRRHPIGKLAFSHIDGDEAA